MRTVVNVPVLAAQRGINGVEEAVQNDVVRWLGGTPGSPAWVMGFNRSDALLIRMRDALFWTLGLMLVFNAMRRYIFEGSVDELVEAIIRLGVVWLVLVAMAPIVLWLWEFQGVMREALNRSITQQPMGREGPVYLLANGMWDQITGNFVWTWRQPETYPEANGWLAKFNPAWLLQSLALGVWALVSDIIAGGLMLVLLLLSVLVIFYALFVYVWAIVGFFLTVVMGPLLFPFMLFRPLEFLARSWISSVANMWIYGVVATLVFAMSSWLLGVSSQVGGSIVGGAAQNNAAVLVSLIFVAVIYGMLKNINSMANALATGGGIGGGASGAGAPAGKAAKGMLTRMFKPV